MSELTPSEFNHLMNRALKAAISKATLKRLGDVVVKDLVERVRSGYGLKDGQQKKLKRLSPSYIKQRRDLKLDVTTSPSKSNLTQTGEMLRSIKAKTSFGEINIDVSNNNSDKAESVSKARPFLGLTDKEEERLVKAIEKELKKEIAKRFK